MTVTLGILRMPESLALGDEFTKMQFFATCSAAADELERLYDTIDEIPQCWREYIYTRLGQRKQHD